MRKKSIKWLPLFSILLAFALTGGATGAATPVSPAYLEQGGTGTQFIEQIRPWSVEQTGAASAPGQTKGHGIKVAVLDTGIDLHHADLRVAGEVTFVKGTTSGDDDSGHGTLVAGIIAALDNDYGTVGIAPEAKLYSVKILNKDGVGDVSTVLSGIEWAIDNDMQVINISCGSLTNMPSRVRKALDKAYDAGIVIVASAGNDGTTEGEGDTIWAPAKYQSVIAVGAIDEFNRRNISSGTGDTLELVAPGINIHSTALGGVRSDVNNGHQTFHAASSPA